MSDDAYRRTSSEAESASDRDSLITHDDPTSKFEISLSNLLRSSSFWLLHCLLSIPILSLAAAMIYHAKHADSTPISCLERHYTYCMYAKEESSIPKNSQPNIEF